MRAISDIYLISLLKLKGYHPASVRSEHRRVVWQFEPSPALEADLAAYFDGTEMVSALDYAAQLRNVKGEVMNAREVTAVGS